MEPSTLTSGGFNDVGIPSLSGWSLLTPTYLTYVIHPSLFISLKLYVKPLDNDIVFFLLYILIRG